MRRVDVRPRSRLSAWLCVLILLPLAIASAAAPLQDDCPVDVSKGESTPDVLQWATSLGADCKSLRADTTLKVRGVVATADIPAGSVIASLPRKIVLSVSPEQKCPIPDLVPETIWGSTPKYFQLALLFLSEVKQGSASLWHPYIQSLPRHLDTLVHWSNSELAELQYDSTKLEEQFIDEAKQQLDDIKELYEKVRWADLVTKANSTLEDLIWASDIVRSRAFAISTTPGWINAKSIGIAAFMANVVLRIPFFGQWPAIQRIIGICRSVTFVCMGAILFGAQTASNLDLALMPVVDSINHNSSSMGSVQPGRSGTTITVDAWIGPEGAKAGEEVTAAYATASNEVLLQHYGFVDMHNINDAYTADVLEFIEQNVIDQPNEEQLQAVRADHGLKKALTQAKLTSKGWSTETMQALRYLLSSREEASAAQSWNPVRWVTHVVRNQQLPAAGYAFSQPQSSVTETKVDQVLHSLCQDISKAKPTTLQEDEEALSQSHQSSSLQRRTLALQFRVVYKQLLQQCSQQHSRA